jgi:hypothetical protein
MADFICYYDGPRFGWVVFPVDAEGFQVQEARYYPNKKELMESFK